MPPMPIERTSGSGSATSASRPIATVEPETITERPAWVIVATSAVSTSLALAQLVAEAHDHQQRVVDRDAEPDERDQELDDDRDVGDVGQAQHEREGVEDRGDRDGERHQHGGQRAEHEQQDDQRADPADQRLGEHARRRRRRRRLLASSSASRPVTLTVIRPGGPPAPRARIRSACCGGRSSPRRAGTRARTSCAGRARGTSGCRSRRRAVRAPGIGGRRAPHGRGRCAAPRRVAACGRRRRSGRGRRSRTRRARAGRPRRRAGPAPRSSGTSARRAGRSRPRRRA